MGEGEPCGSYLSGTLQRGSRRGRTGWSLCWARRSSRYRRADFGEWLEAFGMVHLRGEMGRIVHSSSPWPHNWGGLADWKAHGSGWLLSAELIIPLGEGQVGSSEGSSRYGLSHITLGCQSLQKSFGMSWTRAGTATPPPSAGFQGRRWQPALSGFPHRGVEQCNKPQHQSLLSRPSTASSSSPHRALLPRPSRTRLLPGRPSCRPTAANVPTERVFLAEKLLNSLWKQ